MKYEEPNMEVIELGQEDIFTTSYLNNGGDSDGDSGDYSGLF